jgi:hypothetical protein
MKTCPKKQYSSPNVTVVQDGGKKQPSYRYESVQMYVILCWMVKTGGGKALPHPKVLIIINSLLDIINSMRVSLPSFCDTVKSGKHLPTSQRKTYYTMNMQAVSSSENKFRPHQTALHSGKL